MRGHYLCEDAGKFERSGSCDPAEWCNGPSDAINATYDNLCKHGGYTLNLLILTFEIIRILAHVK